MLRFPIAIVFAIILTSLLFTAFYFLLLVSGIFSGMDLAGLLLAEMVSAVLAFTGAFLTLRKFAGARTAVTCTLCSVFLYAAAFVIGLRHMEEQRLALSQQQKIETIKQSAIDTITLGTPKAILGGKHWSKSNDLSQVLYEDCVISLPVHVTQAGKYKIDVLFQSAANQRTAMQHIEQELAAGDQTITTTFTFGQMWGFFNHSNAQNSTLQVRIEKSLSPAEIQRIITSKLPELIDRFTTLGQDHTERWHLESDTSITLLNIINNYSNSYPPHGYNAITR